MKRRRQDTQNKGNQLKISRFFPATNQDSKSNCVTEKKTENLSKSLKVGIPFCIDALENETTGANSCTEKNKKTSSGMFKLQQFVQTDDSNSIGEIPRENEMQVHSKMGSPQLLLSTETCPKLTDTVTNNLLNHESNLKLTPLEQQVVTLKEKHSEILLVVECGYKYQMFGEDAAMAGTILNMVAYKKNNFLSCSFPLHRLYVHVKKLVAHGCKVGIVRQKETTALKAVGDSKHTPFKRELDIVFTKATFIDNDFDGIIDTQIVDIPLCMTFVAEAYAKTDGTVAQIGILAFFIQDSTVVFDHFQDDCARNGLDSKLTHFQPSEIVLPDRGVTNQTLNVIHQFSNYKSSIGDCVRTEFTPQFDWTTASEMLSKNYCEDSEMMEKLQSLPPVIVCCLAIAYNHLKQFKLEQLVNAIKNVKPLESLDEILQMDGSCLRNLNLVPLNDEAGPQWSSVFHVVNRTRTRFGARLLRSWLLRPLANRDAIESRLEAVGWFVEHFNDAELAPFKKFLKSLQDLEKQLTAVLHARSRPKDFCALCRSWEHMKVLCVQLQSHYQDAFPPPIASLIDLVVQSLDVAYYTEQLNDAAISSEDKTKLFNNIGNYPEMGKLIEKICQAESQLEALKPSICKTIGLLAFNYVTVSGDEYLIEVKNALLRAVPASWIKLRATKQCCRFRSPEVHQLYQELCCYRELLKIAADEAWRQFQRQVATSYLTLKKANTAIATLDCLISLADVAQSENFVRPKFVDQAGVLDISQGRHPVVGPRIQQTSSTEYVPNDTRLNADDVRCMIITGPNMGGKSCLLSQVGIIVVLAQIGSFVPAVQATLSVFKSIFIRMGLHDEIYAGRSTFFIEMMEASAILKKGSSRSLVIIDELGRGTGTHDGSALAYATLKYLVEQTKCITLFVTHYPAVVQLENDIPSVANYHMGYLLESEEADNGKDVMDKEALVFLYALTPGKCPKSFGLNVARLAGIQPTIIEKAKLKSESFFAEAESQGRQVAEFQRLYQEMSHNLSSPIESKSVHFIGNVN